MFGLGKNQTRVVYTLTPVEKARLEAYTKVAAGVEALAQQDIRDILVREKLEKEGFQIQFDRQKCEFVRIPLPPSEAE